MAVETVHDMYLRDHMTGKPFVRQVSWDSSSQTDLSISPGEGETILIKKIKFYLSEDFELTDANVEISPFDGGTGTTDLSWKMDTIEKILSAAGGKDISVFDDVSTNQQFVGEIEICPTIVLEYDVDDNPSFDLDFAEDAGSPALAGSVTWTVYGCIKPSADLGIENPYTEDE